MSKRVGQFLLEQGFITRDQLESILKFTSGHPMRFGDAAIHLGILTPQKVTAIFGVHNRYDFFHLEASRIPESARGLLSIEQILKFGLLYLGKDAAGALQFGLLNPANAGAQQLVSQLSASDPEKASAKVFLLLADQFMDVLVDLYGIHETDLQQQARSSLEPLLASYLRTQVASA